MPGCAYMDLNKWFDNFHISEFELREMLNSLLPITSPGLKIIENDLMVRYLDYATPDIKTFYNSPNQTIVWKNIICSNNLRAGQFQVSIYGGDGYGAGFKQFSRLVSPVMPIGHGGNILQFEGPLIQGPNTTLVVTDLDYVPLDTFTSFGTTYVR